MYKLSYYHTQEALTHSFNLVHSREGMLKKSETNKIYILYSVSAVLIGIIFGVATFFLSTEMTYTKSEIFGMIFSTSAVFVLFYLFFFLIFAYMTVKRRKTQVSDLGKIALTTGFDQKTPKTAEFLEENLVVTSPYKKYTQFYDEIRYVISDKMNFTVVCDANAFFICIPKDRQNPDELFAIDNFLREKLGNRFIYEMGGSQNA